MNCYGLFHFYIILINPYIDLRAPRPKKTEWVPDPIAYDSFATRVSYVGTCLVSFKSSSVHAACTDLRWDLLCVCCMRVVLFSQKGGGTLLLDAALLCGTINTSSAHPERAHSALALWFVPIKGLHISCAGSHAGNAQARTAQRSAEPEQWSHISRESRTRGTRRQDARTLSNLSNSQTELETERKAAHSCRLKCHMCVVCNRRHTNTHTRHQQGARAKLCYGQHHPAPRRHRGGGGGDGAQSRARTHID